MLNNKISYCTMLLSTDYCKIPRHKNKFGWSFLFARQPKYKKPELSELYLKLFDSTITDAHNSENNLMSIFKCFWKLVDINVIPRHFLDRKIVFYEDFDLGIKNIAITRFNINLLPYSKIKFDTSFADDLIDKTWSFLCENDISPSLSFRKSANNGLSGKIIVTVNGKGVGGDFSIEKDKTISIIINNNAFILNCVYYDKNVMILQFDNSTEHICLFKKESVFAKSSAHIGLDDLQRYLDEKVRQTELNLYERKEKIKERKKKTNKILLFISLTFVSPILCLIDLWVGRWLLGNIFSALDYHFLDFANLQAPAYSIFIPISVILGLFVSFGVFSNLKTWSTISRRLVFLLGFGPAAIFAYVLLWATVDFCRIIYVVGCVFISGPPDTDPFNVSDIDVVISIITFVGTFIFLFFFSTVVSNDSPPASAAKTYT